MTGGQAWIPDDRAGSREHAMQTDPSPSSSGPLRVGSVAALWRYPVKSMMGEELNSSEVTDRGLLGDRQFAVVDRSTGKVGGAKNPRKWGNFFDFRAAYTQPLQMGAKIPPVRITLPDGTVAATAQGDLEQVLSRAFGGTWSWRKRVPVASPRAPRPRNTGRTWLVSTTGTR